MNYYEELGIEIKGRKINDWRIGTRLQDGYKHKRLWHNDNQVTDSYWDTVFYKLPMDKAHGDVLLSGLGLGVLANTLIKKEEVTSVTVVEKYKEVIEMVGPYLHENIRVINEDFLGLCLIREYDYCFIDIWSDDNKKTKNRR